MYISRLHMYNVVYYIRALSLIFYVCVYSYFPFQPSYWLDWLPMYSIKQKLPSSSGQHKNLLQDTGNDQDSSSEDDDSMPLLTRIGSVSINLL